MATITGSARLFAECPGRLIFLAGGPTPSGTSLVALVVIPFSTFGSSRYRAVPTPDDAGTAEKFACVLSSGACGVSRHADAAHGFGAFVPTIPKKVFMTPIGDQTQSVSDLLLVKLAKRAFLRHASVHFKRFRRAR